MRSVLTFLALTVVAPAVIAPASTHAQARTQGEPQSQLKSLELSSWDVPWERTRPRDPYVDAQQRVWFVGQAGNYVARLDPTTGEFKRYEIEPGTNPHNLVVHDGMVWFTGNRNGRILKMDPATGKVTTYMMPDSTVRDPHTMIFDQKGNAWFTAQGAGVVGRLIPSTGAIKLWKLAPRSRPYGIVIDSKGRPWFDEFGANRIGTIDPNTLELKEYTLPNDRTRPRRIALTPDDAVWYGDYTRGYLGRLDPKTGNVEEYPLPSGARSLPYAMAVDDNAQVWLVETGVQPNVLVGFDTHSRQWTSSTVIASEGPNTVRHMTFDHATRKLWFGTDAGTIGAAPVPPRALVP